MPASGWTHLSGRHSTTQINKARGKRGTRPVPQQMLPCSIAFTLARQRHGSRSRTSTSPGVLLMMVQEETCKVDDAMHMHWCGEGACGVPNCRCWTCSPGARTAYGEHARHCGLASPSKPRQGGVRLQTKHARLPRYQHQQGSVLQNHVKNEKFLCIFIHVKSSQNMACRLPTNVKRG